MVFFPYGKDIYGHTGANILDAILAAPLREWMGPTLSYNVFILLSLAFNVWAFSRLAREFTEDRITVWMSSLWFGCSPRREPTGVPGRRTRAAAIVTGQDMTNAAVGSCCLLQEAKNWAPPRPCKLASALLTAS